MSMILEYPSAGATLSTTACAGLTRESLVHYNLRELAALHSPAERAHVVWRDGAWHYQLCWHLVRPGADGLGDDGPALRIVDGVLDSVDGPPPGYEDRIAAHSGTMRWIDRKHVVRALEAAVPESVLLRGALVFVYGCDAHAAMGAAEGQ